MKAGPISGEIHVLLLKGIVLVAVFSGILFAVRFTRRLIDSYAENMTGIPTTILKNILIVILYLTGFMIMLDYLGISITPILTALGVGGLAVLVQVSVAYGSDLSKVEAVTKEAGKQIMATVTGGMPDFEPFIRYHTFGDSGIGFTVVLRAREFTDQYVIKHEFVKKLYEAYAKENIEIPFPVRTLIMKHKTEETAHGLG